VILLLPLLYLPVTFFKQFFMAAGKKVKGKNEPAAFYAFSTKGKQTEELC
jgi:hypothetical protein